MTDFRNLKDDCRHVRWDRPCSPHKERGVTCDGCPEYQPIENRVLVVKLAAVGDVLRTTALLPAVHRAFPGAGVTWITKPAAVPLFAGNSLVDQVLSTGDAVTTALLLSEEFDTILCPDADPEAAALAAAARGRERRGFVRDTRGRVVPLGPGADHWFRMGLSDTLKKANRHTYQSLVAEVLGLDPAAVGEPVLEPAGADRAAVAALRAGWGFAGPLIGLNTGAGARWERKAWTLEHQEGFIRTAVDAGCGVLLLGGPEEVERHRVLAAAVSGPVFDGGNDNSYQRFAALLEACAVVVTGDTLCVHAAAARKVPTVVLFGPTSAAEIELYGRGSKVIPEGLDCLGCYLPTCTVAPHCQERIAPEAVWAAVQALLPST